MTYGLCKKKRKKHTRPRSQKERNLFGAAYGAKKEGKKPPPYVPKSMTKMTLGELKSHLVGETNKKLPRRVRRKK